jgi:membrane protease YdiL (CAAX protease family)
MLMREWNLPLPAPELSPLRIVILLVVFFIAALGEELGWSGYAIDPMQHLLSALRASLVLGAVWAAWHIIAMVQAGQSAASIAWGCLDMVGTRIIMVWIYNNTGRSVFAVALYHTVANVTTKSLFPGGSYDAEPIMSITIAITASIIAVAWGPRTLTRHQSR